VFRVKSLNVQVVFLCKDSERLLTFIADFHNMCNQKIGDFSYFAGINSGGVQGFLFPVQAAEHKKETFCINFYSSRVAFDQLSVLLDTELRLCCDNVRRRTFTKIYNLGKRCGTPLE